MWKPDILKFVDKNNSISCVTFTVQQILSCTLVCRDNEVIIQRNSSTLMICQNDEWLLLSTNIQLQSSDFPIRNLQLDSTQDRILLAWEPPLAEEEILSYNVACSNSDFPQLMLSLVVGSDKTLAEIPVLLTTSQASYRCCVIAVVQESSGLQFLSETCTSITHSVTNGQPTASVFTREISCNTFSSLDWSLVGVTAVSLIVVGILIAIIVSILLFVRKSRRKK